MGYFDGFKLELIRAMRESDVFEGIEIAEAFRPEARAGPVSQAMICVGIDEITSDAGSAQYIGVNGADGADVYGKTMCITASLRVYVPMQEGGLSCHAVFSRIADFLLLGNSTLKVAGLKCGELGYHSGLCAYTLTALAQFKTTAVNQYQDGEVISSVIVTRRGDYNEAGG